MPKDTIFVDTPPKKKEMKPHTISKNGIGGVFSTEDAGKWRILRSNEILQAGDEFFDGKQWQQTKCAGHPCDRMYIYKRLRNESLRPLVDLTQFVQLKPGDIIKPTDEFYHDEEKNWKKTSLAGRKVEGFQIYRRRHRNHHWE